MRKDYSKYLGIPLSTIIKRDMQKLQMTQKSLAAQTNMSYRHFNRLLNTTCKFPDIAESIIEQVLGYETSFISNLRNLQTESRQKEGLNQTRLTGKSLPSIRKCVFWDINPDNLDWSRHRKFIITRVSRYGNAQEKQSVMSFYNIIT